MMAYRDRANAVLPLGQHEIDYANAEHRRIIVALATAYSEEGENSSFYNKPLQYLIDEVNELRTALQKQQSFQGIAIHSYHSWKDMK